MGVAHEINALPALLYLIKMFNDVVTFLSSDAIEVSHVHQRNNQPQGCPKNVYITSYLSLVVIVTH